ncbi:Pentatricopeptide repeat [Parasponia andersonii]|uniref:Pentatricopeptide repeat n=1 Tax=Parasponia andersonii TaxID=3476 RepID=A0A2P5A4F2_PARAD|nr:Pentatricopeptide repeat [Parasponia andersonii]
MASRAAALLILRRRCRDIGSVTESSWSVPLSSNGGFSRLLSSGASNTNFVEDYVENDDLRNRIFRLRQPKRSATNVLQKWINEGNQITLSELRQISKDLRKFQRFKHALEVSEWMVTHDEFELSASDYAIRINLMTKVFGIDAAERYFEGLPLPAKTSETYTSLLHSYAGAKLTEKAEDLYERMKDSDLSFTALTYNEMMTMYISVGHVEKVSLVVEELRRQKVAPDIFTYNLWISSCAATLNIDEVRRILDEMRSDPSSDESWLRYINLANIYVTTGHLTNGEFNSLVSAEIGITQREWITYDFLIILHAGLGNKDRIDQIWKSLRMTNQKMTSRNYICILSSYLMLGHLKEVGEVIDQWKQSTTSIFDVSACGRLLSAFTDIGLAEKAKDFHLLLIQNNSDPADIPSSSTN